jgi:N-acetylmuramoyl-L-alanine amidase
MGAAVVSGLSDFNSRLQAAMAKAKSGAAAAEKAAGAATGAAAPVAPPPPASADEFTERIASALQRATGEAPPPPPTPEAEPESGGPVGVGGRVVRDGDCLASIAVGTGHFWETIWTDPANEELNRVRQDPYVLLPGDRLTIPEKERKDEPIAPEQRHRFKRKGCPEKLVIHFHRENEPRANERYVLTIDGVEIEGVTDPNGRVEQPIPADAREGKITFPDSGDEYELELGKLHPITELSGVQGRLRNLGFFDGPVDGRESDALEQGLRGFQLRYGLQTTGRPDDETRDKLQEMHGS